MEKYGRLLRKKLNSKKVFLITTIAVILLVFAFFYIFTPKPSITTVEKPTIIYENNETNKTTPCIEPVEELDFCQLKCMPTQEELKMARIAWKYIENNYQKKTGLINAAHKYPSAAIWDWAAGVYGMYAAYKFKIIDRVEFDQMFGNFLRGMQSLPLFNNELPNKTYNTQGGYMVNYVNKKVEFGIGWSAADVARFLTSMYMIKSCMPTYAGEIDKLLLDWRYCRVLSSDGDMYGGTVKHGKFNVWHEALTGYEEYLARGFELWKFDATEAKAYKFVDFADIYGIKIPIDNRPFFSNFVGSEPFWFMGFEYGWDSNDTKEYSRRMYQVQEERYKRTGIITAVTEDNIDRRPYFLFNTIYTHGEPWKTINQKGEDYDRYKTVSTKAAIGMKYLFDTPYSNLVFNYMKYNYNERKGYYAGKYEKIAGANKALTLNTNGIILEAMLFSKMGPLLKRKLYSENTYWDYYRNSINNFRCLPSDNNFTVLEPAGGRAKKDCDCNSSLDATSAKIAWSYFENNYNEETGFVNGVHKYSKVSVRHIGSTIFATIAAKELDVIYPDSFDKRVTKLLATLKKLPLYNYELPNNAYHAKSGFMVNSSNQFSQKGTGWNMYDIGRLLTSLYILARDYERYSGDVYEIVNRFNFKRAVKDDKIFDRSFNAKKNIGKFYPIDRPAYAFYISNALKFFNINSHSDLFSEMNIEYKAPYLHEIPMNYKSETINAEPYLWTMIEQPYFLKYSHYSSNIYMSLKDRYEITKKITTSSEEAVDSKPRYVHNYIYDRGILWNTVGRDKKVYPKKRVISTKMAFIYSSLYPDDRFSKVLMERIKDRFSETKGWFGGVYSKSRQTNFSLNISTNTAVLEALWYKKVGNIYYRKNKKALKEMEIVKPPKEEVYSLQSREFEPRNKAEKLLLKLKDAPYARIEREGLNFVVKVGAFKSEEEALEFQNTEDINIPNAQIVENKIDPKKIINSVKVFNYVYRHPFRNRLKIAKNKGFEKARKIYLDKRAKEKALKEKKEGKAKWLKEQALKKGKESKKRVKKKQKKMEIKQQKKNPKVIPKTINKSIKKTYKKTVPKKKLQKTTKKEKIN